MKTRIKFATVFWMIVLVSSFGGWNIAAAQDTTATPEGEATVEVTEVVVVPPPAATDEPVVVDEPAPTPEETVTIWSMILDKVGDIGMLIAIVVLAFKTGSLIPADTVDKALEQGFGFAKTIAAKTETTLDDSFLNVSEESLRRFVKEELAKRDSVVTQVMDSNGLVRNHTWANGEPVG